MTTPEGIRLGEDVAVGDWSGFKRPRLCEIGSHVAIDDGFICTTRLKVGDYVHVSYRVTVIGGAEASLELGDFCFVSAGSTIVCCSDDFLGSGLIVPFIAKRLRSSPDNRPVVFQPFSGLGAHCVVLPGVTLGEGSVVGACSLVKRDTEPWAVYAGTPAQAVGKRRKDKILANARELGYGAY